ncbi:MAG: DUF1573 domain-containing protein [Candidatus Omnitrophota bacterium]|nr:MAG: DUF1573 domain-containing protein [Candidatus Omnitrophota bacterium]
MVKIGIILAFIFSCYAQENSQMIEFDFGEIAHSRRVAHRFEFDEEIKSAVSLCECIQAEVYRDEVASKYIVEVEFDPQEYRGQTTQEILLLDSKHSIIRLRITAFVKEGIGSHQLNNFQNAPSFFSVF